MTSKTYRVATDLNAMASKLPPANGSWLPSSTGALMCDENDGVCFILQDFDGKTFLVTVQPCIRES